VEKFWNRIERIGMYKKLSGHKLLGKIVNREVLSYLFFGALTTVVSVVTFDLAERLFLRDGVQGLFERLFVRPELQSLLLRLHLKGDSYAYIDANVISWIFAVAFAFVTNKLFVFNARSGKGATLWREIRAFVGARLATLLADTALMFLLVTVLGMTSLAAKIIVQFIVVVLNYALSKLFVFKKSKESAGS